jgi:hypothetical protein
MSCHWIKYIKDSNCFGDWETTCGEKYPDPSPNPKTFTYCPFCGKNIYVVGMPVFVYKERPDCEKIAVWQIGRQDNS